MRGPTGAWLGLCIAVGFVYAVCGGGVPFVAGVAFALLGQRLGRSIQRDAVRKGIQ